MLFIIRYFAGSKKVLSVHDQNKHLEDINVEKKLEPAGSRSKRRASSGRYVVCGYDGS